MKELITEALQKRIGTTLESLGGASAVFGDPIEFNGEQVIPVARIRVQLSADADGEGGGGAGIASAISNRARGAGSGSAAAGIEVSIEPAGVLRKDGDALAFVAIQS
jgi:uncharacterized spore protein YtfJ